MLSNAVALAILTTTGFVVVYQKLPRRVRRFVEKYSLFTDAVTLMLVYFLLGGTLTALVAGAMCGLFISVLLHIANNPDDFLFLYDFRDMLKSNLKQVQEALKEYGKAYRAKKEAAQQPNLAAI